MTYRLRLDTGQIIKMPATVSKVVYYNAERKKISKAEYERLVAVSDSKRSP